jgi:hypothetical protein
VPRISPDPHGRHHHQLVFNQDAAGAKRAASQGPVFITNRGRPAHVLRSIADLLALSGGGGGIWSCP